MTKAKADAGHHRGGAGVGGGDQKRAHVLDDLDITGDELQRIQSAFQNADFKRLFGEYMTEIADPDNRRLYEQELTQLELERGVRMQFVRPEPGYVLQTIADGLHRTFVNVAQCDLIGRPSSECGRQGDRGTIGLHWRLPYAQAPVHRDYDDETAEDGVGGLCQVYDVIFHPDTLHLAGRDARFKELVTCTALEAVRDAFDVQLDMVNVRQVVGVTFKGPVRPTVLRTKIDTMAAGAPPSEANDPLHAIYPPVPSATKKQPTAKARNAKPKDERDASYTEPAHQLVHRKHVDYADMTHELDAKAAATVPDELVLTVELPMLSNVGDVQLDVTADAVFVCSERPARYRLRVRLPHRVCDERATARFCSDKRRLVVTLPVVKRAPTVEEICASRGSGGGGAIIEEEEGVNAKLEDVKRNRSKKTKQSNPVPDSNGSSTENALDVAAVPVADVPFLDPSIRYLLPPFDSQYAGKGTLFISLPVRNVDTTAAVAIDQRCTAPRTVHVRFQTLGAGYVTQHYALFVRLPYDVRFVQPDIWANEVTLRLDLDGCGSEQMLVFEAGIDEPSVERFESKLTAEISDDDGGAFGMQALDKALLDSRPTPGAMLKQRSYSESNCDDFKDAGDGDVDDDDNDDVDAFDASHQPKVRTYSECSVDSSASHGLKGILKRRSSSVLSEIGGSIPEAAAAEQMAGSLGKKSVRFDNNIRKLKFKLNSTVAGQRKPKANGHNRKKKKRCAERRYSEGEASDYDPKEAEDAACGRGQPSDAASQSPRKVPPNGSGVNGVPASRVAAAGGQRDDCDLDFKTNLIFDMDM